MYFDNAYLIKHKKILNNQRVNSSTLNLGAHDKIT